jgi:hypothetical protein
VQADPLANVVRLIEKTKGISMRRDMELVRQILRQIEACTTLDRTVSPPQIEGYTAEHIRYHLLLSSEAGLLRLYNVPADSSLSAKVMIERLTWDGHGFLDASGEEGRWRKAMATVQAHAGTVTYDVLMELLKTLMKNTLGLS